MEQIQLSPANAALLQKAKENPNIQPQNTDVLQKQDKFETQTPAVQQTELNTYQATAKSNINFKGNYKGIALLSTTIALACTIGLIVQGKGSAKLLNKLQNTQKELSSAASKLQESADSINILNTKLSDADIEIQSNAKAMEKLNEVIDALKSKLNLLSNDDKNFEILKKDRISHYSNIANNSKLSYDPMTPPIIKECSYSFITKKFPFVDTAQNITSKQNDTYTQDLINKFQANGAIEIPLAKKTNPQEVLEKASIKNLDTSFFNVGKPQAAGITMNYGVRTNWSDEKISRDILQNFFDANNHTLDGVGISVNKSDSNKFKIRVSGNAVYDCKSLLELGSGNKLNESPYNAGGFGEGSRVVVASLLGQKKTSAVKFASSDWKMEFKPDGESIVRKIDKAPNILDGNYIEFETTDKNFIQSLLKSVNFFDNSKNPDFKNLTFENENFAFKILKPNEKGNFYLTQRFEYGKQGAWEDNVEGMNLIFKRKPDFDKFKEITGNEFAIGRDRLPTTYENIYDLTKYFASDLSDEELINSILSTKIQWQNIPEKEESAIKSFINALCDVADNRRIGIDFGDLKICKLDEMTSEAVYKNVLGMGYKITPKSLKLDKIGMDTTKDVMKKSSSHTPLAPTKTEVKKLKLLEEATKTIQESIMQTYPDKLKFIFENTKDSIKINTNRDLINIIDKLKDSYRDDAFVKKYINTGYNDIIDFDKFNKEFTAFLSNKIDTINCENIDKNASVTSALSHALTKSADSDGVVLQYSEQLKNLQIIAAEDVSQPRYIFNRYNEIDKNTLGEAILGIDNLFEKSYAGHWVDRTYLNNGNFYDLVATWLHEISHKSGGDGSSEFTYKLTDLIEALTDASTNSPSMRLNLSAIENVFNSLS